MYMERYIAPVQEMNSEITLDENHPSSYVCIWGDIKPQYEGSWEDTCPSSVHIYVCFMSNGEGRDTPMKLHGWDEKLSPVHGELGRCLGRHRSWYTIVKNHRSLKPVVCHRGPVRDHPYNLVNLVVFYLNSSQVNCMVGMNLGRFNRLDNI